MFTLVAFCSPIEKCDIVLSYWPRAYSSRVDSHSLLLITEFLFPSFAPVHWLNHISVLMCKCETIQCGLLAYLSLHLAAK